MEPKADLSLIDDLLEQNARLEARVKTMKAELEQLYQDVRNLSVSGGPTQLRQGILFLINVILARYRGN